MSIPLGTYSGVQWHKLPHALTSMATVERFPKAIYIKTNFDLWMFFFPKLKEISFFMLLSDSPLNFMRRSRLNCRLRGTFTFGEELFVVAIHMGLPVLKNTKKNTKNRQKTPKNIINTKIRQKNAEKHQKQSRKTSENNAGKRHKH